MITLNLDRLKYNTKTCVFGVIRIGKEEFVTLELPWNDNKKCESCIPEGSYLCRRICSPKFGDTFEICGVEDRSNILFHYGNSAKSTKGCVLIGERFDLKNESITNSRKAFGNFMNELRFYKNFILKVRQKMFPMCASDEKAKIEIPEENNSGKIADLKLCGCEEIYDQRGHLCFAEKYRCSLCGLVEYVVDGHTAQFKFCHRCGAKVRFPKPSIDF